MKKLLLTSGMLLALFLSSCNAAQTPPEQETMPDPSSAVAESAFTTETSIQDVVNDPAFGEYGRLLFPTNEGYYGGETLGELELTFYSHIDPDKTVEIASSLKSRALAGETIFYDIYTDAEKAEDPAKEDTGLFFFKGEPGEKFAVCNAGGAFAYVGAM